MGEVKREQDCTTLDHWRIRAMDLENQWARCSQACTVMQTERDALRAENDRLTDKALRYDLDQLGISQREREAAELVDLRAEVAKLKSENGRLTDVLLSKHGGEPLQLMDELDDARAEVAKLRAACAAKDASLWLARAAGVAYLTLSSIEIATIEAALSDDAGKNYVDASGAVEAKAVWGYLDDENGYSKAAVAAFSPLPDDWAGRTVLVMVKP